MKSLSAHHFRETRRAVEPARAYREGIERFAAWTNVAIAAGAGPTGLLVIGGELGLCGAYNSHVVAAGQKHRDELGPGPTFCVGHRASILLARRGVEITTTYAAPTSVQGITDLLLRLAQDVLDSYVTQRLSSFDIVSSRFGGVGNDLPVTVRLLPVVAPKSEHAPAARYISGPELDTAVARELLYITLYDLVLDSLASEHSARLIATQSAEKWLDQRIAQLGRLLAATLREASTQEVIEIASSAQTRRQTRPG